MRHGNPRQAAAGPPDPLARQALVLKERPGAVVVEEGALSALAGWELCGWEAPGTGNAAAHLVQSVGAVAKGGALSLSLPLDGDDRGISLPEELLLARNL